jgi:hypothetical protein
MDTKDKIYGSDILLGNVDPDDLMLGPSFTNSLHDELFKAKPKKVEVKKPQRPIPTQRPKAIPRTTMVKGKPGEFNLAEPAKKLGALKQNIHRTGNKPTTQQLQQYYELSAEIERRGESYFQKLAELYDEGDNSNDRQKYKNKKT